MLKLHSLTVLLLAGALSLQPAISAEKAKSAGGDKAGQPDGRLRRKPRPEAEQEVRFHTSAMTRVCFPERRSRQGNTPWCRRLASKPFR